MTELRNQDEETPAMGPWPYFAPDEIEAVAKVLRSGKVSYWTGTDGREFEKEYAAFVRCQHGVAVANGSVSLELALYALSVSAGDEVIVTPRSFVASASCVVMRGATPVAAFIRSLGELRGDARRHAGNGGRRSRVSEHYRRDACQGPVVPHQGDHLRAPCRLAV